MFFEGVLAGILIAIGATAYLRIGGYIGALIFSVGLVCIISMGFKLFTGQCGNALFGGKNGQKPTPWQLCIIWCGNLVGAIITGFLLYLSPIAASLISVAQPIVANAIAAGFFGNLILGGFCGLLMYCATYFKEILWLRTVLCVVAFIVCGFSHSIAMMAYLAFGATALLDWWILIPITLGNLLGSWVIPVFQRVAQYLYSRSN